MGMALPGILGTLRSEGHRHGDIEQNGFQHSTRSSARNQTCSWLSTKIKSPSTGIISVKQFFCSIAIKDKSAPTLALAKATSGLVHQRAEAKVYSSYACEEIEGPHVALFSELTEVLEQFPLS